MRIAEFDELFQQCSNWGRWGSDDVRGALNLIDARKVVDAAKLVVTGQAVSCGRVLETARSIDNPLPVVHEMTSLPWRDPPAEELVTVAADRITIECHGEVHSHVDALCHIAYRGLLYNGRTAASVGVGGAEFSDLGVLSAGLLSRGVLLDVAGYLGRDWLEGGTAIDSSCLADTARTQAVSIEPGDVVLIRTGQSAKRSARGPWDSANDKAGLAPSAMPWLKERDVAAVGFDGDGDVEPHDVHGVSVPIHVLGITAMGLHFFDALDLEKLAAVCRESARYAFFFTALPLRCGGATGCAVNPLAVF